MDPEQPYRWYETGIDLLKSAARTGAPTTDQASVFFGLPREEFIDALREVRDEVEQRAYLAIVAAVEAVLQLDFRSRIQARASVPLRDEARRLNRQERRGRRILLEDVLDCWANLPEARGASIGRLDMQFPRA